MFYVRVDANPVIASGHMMRCIAIVNQLEKIGMKSTFLTADKEAGEWLEERGYENQCLLSQYNDLEGELAQLLPILEQSDTQGILIDSYYVTEGYLNTLRKITKVIYIDDVDAFLYPVHMLIQYTAPLKMKHYKKEYEKTNTKLLLGSNYIPLREEFQKNVSYMDKTFTKNALGTTNYMLLDKKQPMNILLTTGGSDTYNFCGNFIEFLLEKERHVFLNSHFHIIVGRYNIFMKQLEDLSYEYENVSIYKNVMEMSLYMKGADIAISAGGTTLYELCACGTPAISFTFADNQKEGAKYLHQKEMIFYAGDLREIDDCREGIQQGNQVMEQAAKQLIWLQEHENERNQLKIKMKELVDGYGAKRIAEEINKLVNNVI